MKFGTQTASQRKRHNLSGIGAAVGSGLKSKHLLWDVYTLYDLITHLNRIYRHDLNGDRHVVSLLLAPNAFKLKLLIISSSSSSSSTS